MANSSLLTSVGALIGHLKQSVLFPTPLLYFELENKVSMQESMIENVF